MALIAKPAMFLRRVVFFSFLAGTATAGSTLEVVGADQLMQLSLEQLLNVEVVSASKFSQRSDEAPASDRKSVV
jgi:hypothetical protein